MVAMICKCINKVVCGCANFLTEPVKTRISERELAEWKRIEGIDQFIQKRH